MRVSIIVAMDENGGIGIENQLPWRLPADLRRFKRLTMGHHLIVGRKTYESIGRLLPGREMIVLTRSIGEKPPNYSVAATLEKALAIARRGEESEVFIAGGAEVYRLALPVTDRIYLTRVHARTSADTYFPKIDLAGWNIVLASDRPADEQNPFATTFQILEKSS